MLQYILHKQNFEEAIE